MILFEGTAFCDRGGEVAWSFLFFDSDFNEIFFFDKVLLYGFCRVTVLRFFMRLNSCNQAFYQLFWEFIIIILCFPYNAFLGYNAALRGGRSSVGRAQDCGSWGRGIETRRPPHSFCFEPINSASSSKGSRNLYSKVPSPSQASVRSTFRSSPRMIFSS